MTPAATPRGSSESSATQERECARALNRGTTCTISRLISASENGGFADESATPRCPTTARQAPDHDAHTSPRPDTVTILCYSGSFPRPCTCKHPCDVHGGSALTELCRSAHARMRARVGGRCLGPRSVAKSCSQYSKTRNTLSCLTPTTTSTMFTMFGCFMRFRMVSSRRAVTGNPSCVCVCVCVCSRAKH